MFTDPISAVRDRLVAQRVIPVLRLSSAELAERAVGGLIDAGFRTVEITLTTPHAIELIERLARRVGAELTEFLIGAGTVLDLNSAARCLDAGARFLVSPGLVPGMARRAHEARCAALIGAYTPGEVLAARRADADIVKIFPASSGGPEHLRALHTVFPQLLFCPTGGVSLQNMAAYFAAGAALVGVGNQVIDLPALEAGDLARVAAHARRFLHPEGA